MSIALPAFGPTDIDNPAAAVVYVDQQSQIELGMKHRSYTFPEIWNPDYITGESEKTDPSLAPTAIQFGLRAAIPRLTPGFLKDYGNLTFFLNLRTPPSPSLYPIMDPNVPQAYSLQVEENIANIQLGLAFPLPAGFSLGVGGHVVAVFDMPIGIPNIGVTGEMYSNSSYGEAFVGNLKLSAQLNNIPFYSSFVILPMLGLQWDVGKAVPALDGLQFGVVYRARHENPFYMSAVIDQIEVDVDVQGENVHQVIEIDPESGDMEFTPLHLVYIPANTGISVGWKAPSWRTEVGVRQKKYSQMIFAYFGIPEDLMGEPIHAQTANGDDIELSFTLDTGFDADWEDYIELRDVYEVILNGAWRAANWDNKAPLWIEGNFFYHPSYVVSQQKSYVLDPSVVIGGISLLQTIPFGDGYGVDIRLGFNAGRLSLTTAGPEGAYEQETPYGAIIGGSGSATFRF